MDKLGDAAESVRKNGLYGLRPVLTVVDEASTAVRKVGQSYMSVLALTGRSSANVFLTATPLVQSPAVCTGMFPLPPRADVIPSQDLWNAGRALRVPFFHTQDANRLYLELCRQHAAAQKQDRQLALHPVAPGGEEPGQSAVFRTFLTWSDRLRAAFKEHIIRRTNKSVDCDGNPISGLDPYTDIILGRDLYRGDQEQQERLLAVLAGSRGQGAGGGGGGSNNFYLAFRLSLIHPVLLNSFVPFPHDVTTQAGYAAFPSMKIDSLISICDHHIRRQELRPLKVASVAGTTWFHPTSPTTDSLVLDEHWQAPPRKPNAQQPSSPNKVVVYCTFVDAARAFVRILGQAGFNAVLYNSHLSMSQRDKILKDFRSKEEGKPSVLVLSQMGVHGLNLPIANVLVIVVSPLSCSQASEHSLSSPGCTLVAARGQAGDREGAPLPPMQACVRLQAPRQGLA